MQSNATESPPDKLLLGLLLESGLRPASIKHIDVSDIEFPEEDNFPNDCGHLFDHLDQSAGVVDFEDWLNGDVDPKDWWVGDDR